MITQRQLSAKNFDFKMLLANCVRGPLKCFAKLSLMLNAILESSEHNGVDIVDFYLFFVA